MSTLNTSQVNYWFAKNRLFNFLFILLLAFPFFTKAQVIEFEGLKKINGTSLYFKIIGKGEPILILHGGPGLNQSYFMPHLNTLAKKYKLIFYDQRASGQSQRPVVDSISLSLFVDDIEAIRKEFRIEKINLFAHSWSSLLAVRYAQHYPDKVNKMILCNPAPLSHEFDQTMAEAQLNRIEGKDSTDRSIILGSKDFKTLQAEAYKKLLLLTFRHSFYKAENSLKLQLDLPTNYIPASRSLYQGLTKDLADYNDYPVMARFNFPVLILHGIADVIPLKSSQQILENTSKSTLIIFSKSGHFIFIDEPKKFNQTVIFFLRKPIY